VYRRRRFTARELPGLVKQHLSRLGKGAAFVTAAWPVTEGSG
jgi:hypothetical protein